MKYLNFANRVQSNNQPETLLTLVDLSGSMYADDIKPSRMEAAIRANQEIIRVKKECHPNDKIGVISFQETAKLSLPPMYPTEIGDLGKIIDGTGLVGGTNFVAPLILACNYFLSRPPIPGKSPISKMVASIFTESCLEKYLSIKSMNDGIVRRIILLTDGEHLGRIGPIGIANKLKVIGVTIDCIGIGGSPKDVDEELLKQIASRNPDGSIRYCFIGDQQQLLRKYQTLAHHIRAV